MGINIENRMNIFINLVNEKYPQLYIDYEKNNLSDSYKIWHNNEELEYRNQEFRIFTGKLLTEIFLDADIYNVYMTYDYDKSISIKNAEFIFIDENYMQNEPIEVNCAILKNDNNIVINTIKYIDYDIQKLESGNLKDNASVNEYTNALAA